MIGAEKQYNEFKDALGNTPKTGDRILIANKYDLIEFRLIGCLFNNEVRLMVESIYGFKEKISLNKQQFKEKAVIMKK